MDPSMFLYVCLGRIGMDYEPQNNEDTERDVEIRPMHVSGSVRRKSLSPSCLFIW